MPITVNDLKEQVALMDCSSYSASPRAFLGESKSKAEIFNASLRELKKPELNIESSKIEGIEKTLVNNLKKDLLEYASYFENKFQTIKTNLSTCPLSDENKRDMNAYVAHCEKYKGLFKNIEVESNKLSIMSNTADRDNDLVLRAFCDSVKRMLDTAKEDLKDPTKTISQLPPASWVEKAYKETKSDLGYCKIGKEKQNFLQKKLDVFIADAAVRKVENPPVSVKLNALEAKLKYQESLYTARQGAGKEHYGFFIKFGHSASDKLKETKAMLEEITRLKDNKPDTESKWTPGDAAKQGALKDLYKELQNLGGKETPKSTSAPKP